MKKSDVQINQQYQYRKNPDLIYTVLFITNTAHQSPTHPPDVVYQGKNGNVWSRPLSDFIKNFKKI